MDHLELLSEYVWTCFPKICAHFSIRVDLPELNSLCSDNWNQSWVQETEVRFEFEFLGSNFWVWISNLKFEYNLLKFQKYVEKSEMNFELTSLSLIY